MGSIKTIVCTTDLSSASEHALEVALDLAKDLQATVHLIHVTALPMLATPEGAVIATADMLQQMTSAANDGLRDLAQRWGNRGIKINTHVVQGNPAESIIEEARKLGGDLIVIATHGRSGLAHLLIGSVAESVVRQSEIPVLTVRVNPN